MKTAELTDLFVKQANARKDGNAYLIPGETEATLFVAFPGETLLLPKVSRLEVAEPFLLVDTVRGERFVISAEDVRALKLDKAEGARRERGAGFSSK
jgi:hypothetical protein